MKNFPLSLITVFIFSLFSHAQDSSKPFSWSYEGSYQANIESFTGVPFKKLAKEDAKNDLDKSTPWRFGYDFATNIDPGTHGEYINLPNGDRVWRVRIQSPGAKTINLFFDWYKLAKGARLFVAAYDQSDRTKELTYLQNNPNDAIGIWPVKSDDVWVELYEPSDVVGQSILEIANVVHGYRTIGESPDAKALNDSGSCNQDVDCDITPPGADPFNVNQKKEDVKKSVAMMVVGNSGVCTGSLVNNTAQNGEPLFLTANHCGNQVSSWSYRFNWRSDNPSCGTTANSGNGGFDQTAVGATLLMNNSGSDTTLVRITDAGFFNSTNPPDVVWNGWNRSTTATPQLNFGVHHPSGDIQKACRDDQGATRTSTSFNGNGNAQMWRIADWDLGVTERGSSGSPLFDQDGRVIGVLSGGSAACVGTNDNGGFDIYGRFGVAWDQGTTASTRLRDWLDPNGTGAVTLDQYPPINQFPIDAAVSLQNAPQVVCGSTITPDVVIRNAGTQPLTSVDIVYNFNNGGNTTISWTGNLSQNATAVVSLPSFTLNSGSNNLFVNLINPNNSTDPNVSNNSVVANFTRDSSQSFVANNFVTFNITTDNYANETSWECLDSSGAIVASGARGSLPANATTYSRTIPIVQGECYTFTINDSQSDGICCSFGVGSYNLTTDTGTVITTGGQFGASETTKFNVTDTSSVDDSLEEALKIYPNPSSGLFTIEFSQKSSYSLYNLSGKLIKTGPLDDNSSILDLSSLSNGMYFLSIEVNDTTLTRKLIKK